MIGMAAAAGIQCYLHKTAQNGLAKVVDWRHKGVMMYRRAGASD